MASSKMPVALLAVLVLGLASTACGMVGPRSLLGKSFCTAPSNCPSLITPQCAFVTPRCPQTDGSVIIDIRNCFTVARPSYVSYQVSGQSCHKVENSRAGAALASVSAKCGDTVSLWLHDGSVDGDGSRAPTGCTSSDVKQCHTCQKIVTVTCQPCSRPPAPTAPPSPSDPCTLCSYDVYGNTLTADCCCPIGYTATQFPDNKRKCLVSGCPVVSGHMSGTYLDEYDGTTLLHGTDIVGVTNLINDPCLLDPLYRIGRTCMSTWGQCKAACAGYDPSDGAPACGCATFQVDRAESPPTDDDSTGQCYLKSTTDCYSRDISKCPVALSSTKNLWYNPDTAPMF